MKNGKINIEVEFPLIVSFEKQFYVAETVSQYTTCKKKFIPILEGLTESVIDANGILYKRHGVKFFKYVNAFLGFSIKYAGFGACYVEKELERVGAMNVDDLKRKGHQIINSNKNAFVDIDINVNEIRTEFDSLLIKEDILTYMRYLTDVSRFRKPTTVLLRGKK